MKCNDCKNNLLYPTRCDERVYQVLKDGQLHSPNPICSYYKKFDKELK